MVAGEHVVGHRQRREQLAHARVLARVAGVGEVAAHEHGVGRGVERRDGGDGGGERPVGRVVAEADVGIAQLGQHLAQVLVSS